MAEDKKKSSNKSSAPKEDKSRLDISMQAVVDNIVFNKKDQIAYYRIPNIAWDFLSDDAKYAHGMKILNGLAALMGDRSSSLECHTIVTNNPLDVDMWESQVRSLSEDWEHAPGFEEYLEKMRDHIYRQGFSRKVTYLGIRLGARGSFDPSGANVMEMGWKEAKDFARGLFQYHFGVVSEEVSDDEEKVARTKENLIRTILTTGNLQAAPATTEEILLLTKRILYPALPTPYLEVDHGNRVGIGDMELEYAHDINNKSRWVEVTQMVEVMADNGRPTSIPLTGYRATLSVSKLPPRTYYPFTPPFLYFPTMAGFDCTMFARFTLHSNAKMQKEIMKKKKEQEDEWDNIKVAASQGSELGSVPTAFADAYNDIQEMDRLVSEDKLPWVEGHYRVVVEADNEEDLRQLCTEMKQHYDNIDVKVNWTTGDQVELMLEQMPGDHIRMRSFKHITSLPYFATSGFNFSSDVGDLIKGE